MQRFEITFRNLVLPEEPQRTEVVEAEDQADAMAVAAQLAREDEQIVGLAPAADRAGGGAAG